MRGTKLRRGPSCISTPTSTYLCASGWVVRLYRWPQHLWLGLDLLLFPQSDPSCARVRECGSAGGPPKQPPCGHPGTMNLEAGPLHPASPRSGRTTALAHSTALSSSTVTTGRDGGGAVAKRPRAPRGSGKPRSFYVRGRRDEPPEALAWLVVFQAYFLCMTTCDIADSLLALRTRSPRASHPGVVRLSMCWGLL